MPIVHLPEQALELEIAWVGLSDGAARPDDPVMVFLHEGLGSVAAWRDFPHRLCMASGLSGLVYSRPGYGSSTPRRPDERWGTDFMHRQALEVLPALRQTLGLADQAVWLFGHSDGGSIALLHGALGHQPVAGLVAMAPHVFVEPISLSGIQAACAAYDQGLRERLARYHDDVDSAFRGWAEAWLDPAFLQWDIVESLRGLPCPTLLVQGDQDQYGTLAQLDAIAQAVPHAQRLVLAPCGHSPHRDQPDAVISATCRIVADSRTPHGDTP
jgi:pimeloyl-ACP methyl ester carboxylesterase